MRILASVVLTAAAAALLTSRALADTPAGQRLCLSNAPAAEKIAAAGGAAETL